MESRILKLPGGRDLGYCVAGAENGAPFFTFHGLPGSRMESYLLDAAAKKHNVRIITPDRPGYGLSSWQCDRTLLTWGEDVACLADALNIDTFGVIGVSGGAPCALSCAYTMPQRITRIGIVCGLGPLYHTGLSQDMRWLVAAGFNLARLIPWVLKIVPGLPVLALAKSTPGIMLEIIAMVHGGADRQVLKIPNVREKLILNIKEAFRQGTRGAIQDMQLYSRDWGFLLQGINGHVDIWHGDADDIVPVSHGQFLHQHLPHSTFTVMPGQAHFSLPITCADTILAALKD
ncbi:MAG: alpha/beta hydrolase [Gammaproteobacteria bacterium]|nr:alpha/beta hydrolase [Gammaproteobacteria bacterium]